MVFIKKFGARWAEGSHLQPLSGHPVPALLVQGVGIFLLAWLIGVAIANSAWWVALLIILTCTIILAGSCLFSQKSSYAVATESGFVVTNGAIMLVCQFLL